MTDTIAIIACLLALAGAFASLASHRPSPKSDWKEVVKDWPQVEVKPTTKVEWVPPQERDWYRRPTNFYRSKNGELLSVSMGKPTALVKGDST